MKNMNLTQIKKIINSNELYIQPLCDNGFVGYWAPGHHDSVAFMAEVKRRYDRYIESDRIEQRYFKIVASNHPQRPCLVWTEQSDIDSFPVTMYENEDYES